MAITTGVDTLNTAQTSNAIKKYLKSIFGINAKVKSKSYSGGSSIRISYKGGVNPKEVEKALVGIEYGSYDGMQNLYEYNRASFEIDGKRLTQFKYSFVEREITDDFYFELAKITSRTMNYGFIHKCETRADFERNFESNTCGVWTWQQLIRNMSQNVSLITDKIEDIKILDVFSTGNWTIGFNYEYAGETYSSEDLPKNNA